MIIKIIKETDAQNKISKSVKLEIVKKAKRKWKQIKKIPEFEIAT